MKNEMSPMRHISLWLVRLTALIFAAIASPVLIASNNNNFIDNRQSCNKSSIVEMLNGFENKEKEFEGKETGSFIDISEIAKKYIHFGCDIDSVKTNLINTGFKITDYKTLDSPFFEATIWRKNDWWEITGVEYKVEIEISLKRVKSVKATLIYHNW